MHRLTDYCRYNRFISDPVDLCLLPQHIHYICASTSVYDLHDDPQEVCINEGHMLTDYISMSTCVHDCTFSPELLHRRVLKLGTINYLDRDCLASMGSLEALCSPNDSEVTHAYDNLQSIARWSHWPAMVWHDTIASMLSCQFGCITRGLYHSKRLKS